MKLKNVLVAASAVLISVTSLAAFAEQFTFPLSRTSTSNNPQAFFCTLTENGQGDDIIRLTNWAQMITGFKEGVLMIKPDKLNSVYFLSYHDNSNPEYKTEDGNVIVSAAGYKVTCQFGDGGRKLMDGPYG